MRVGWTGVASGAGAAPATAAASAAAAGASTAGSAGASRSSMQPMNCWSSLSETSCMTPWPNCAGLPVTVRSVVTSARVAPSPSEVSRIVTVAPAVPLLRLSLPLASITARRDWSSRSTKEPDPAYSIAWPSLTLTVPRTLPRSPR